MPDRDLNADTMEGHVVEVAGPTIEIQFPEGHIPKI